MDVQLQQSVSENFKLEIEDEILEFSVRQTYSVQSSHLVNCTLDYSIISLVGYQCQ